MPDMPNLSALKDELRRLAGDMDGSIGAICTEALAAITALEARLAVPVGEALVEAAAREVYDFPMPDGDALAVLIHCSDYIRDDKPLPDQLADVRAICADIARAVLAVAVPTVREACIAEIRALGEAGGG